MSYQTSGVWANNEAGLNFKTADRKGTMLIVGGDTGVLRLYQYPCDVESNDYYKRVTGVSKRVRLFDFSTYRVGPWSNRHQCGMLIPRPGFNSQRVLDHES